MLRSADSGGDMRRLLLVGDASNGKGCRSNTDSPHSLVVAPGRMVATATRKRAMQPSPPDQGSHKNSHYSHCSFCCEA